MFVRMYSPRIFQATVGAPIPLSQVLWGGLH